MAPLPRPRSGFHDAAAQAAHQILWLPDECLRCPAHGGHAWPRRLCRDGERRRRRPRHPQHLPHPREGLREGLFGARAAARRARGSRAQRSRHEDRGRRLRRAGRRRGDHPPRARGRRRGRPAELSSSAATARARIARREGDRDRISAAGQVRLPAAAESRMRSARAASRPSSPCRKAATSSAPSAWCRTRAARKSRARSRRSSTT